MTENPIPFAGVFSSAADRPIVFAGLPDDSRSSWLRGAAGGPARIRAAYDGGCYNATTEAGVDLSGAVSDHGDIASGATWTETANNYREFATEMFKSGRVPFFAGGDHAVTIPVLEALAALGRPVHLVQIDAHPDLYHELDGDPQSHGCVAARALEMAHIATITQYGVRTMSAPQRVVADENRGRLSIVHATDLGWRIPHPTTVPAGADVYLSVDLDGIDPAFAPGVSHPVPGGLSSRQVIDLIRYSPWRLCGMDVVELNPERDERDRTAVLAARLLHEAMGTVK